jgi:hypothetical protein
MTNERKIFIAGFAVLLVIIVWMFMRVENLEKETTNQLESQQQQIYECQHAILLAPKLRSSNRHLEEECSSHYETDPERPSWKRLKGSENWLR